MDRKGTVLSCLLEFSEDCFSLNQHQIQAVERWVASVCEANPGASPKILTAFLVKLLVADPFLNSVDLVCQEANLVARLPSIRLSVDIRKLIYLTLDERGSLCATERIPIFVINRVTTTRASDLFGHASFVSTRQFQRTVRQEHSRLFRHPCTSDFVRIACSRAAAHHVSTIVFPPASGRMVRLRASTYGDSLQFLDTYEAERDIADTLVALKKEPLLSEGAIKNINEWEGLNQAQTEAFKAVARQRLTIISGRAGTGKSHTVRELVRWLACLGLRVFCVSPYHRTVERLRELGIHKCCTATSWRLQSGKPTKEKRAGALCTPEQCLFESTWGKWCLDCGADVIVLDESGIASTHDMAALLRWVSIRDRRLVLVGDTNQQQPIVGGSAISGIIHVCPETVVTLQTVQRVDAHSFHLLDLADAILRGDPTVPERVVFVYGFQDIWPLFSVHRSVVVTHNSKDADEINHLLAARHFASLKRRGRRCERHAKFFYGEMVCVTRGEANGTVGALVATKKLEIPKNETTNETTMVDGAEISIRGKYTIDVPMDALAPGYAATLNQVQGSEFEQVFVVINSAGLGYYGTKRWLYTACTRAKKNLFFVTDALADRAMYSRALSNPCADLSCSTLIPNLFNQNEVSIESVPPWVPEFQPSEFHDYRLALEIGENEPNYESFIGFLRNHVNFLA